MMKNLRTLAVAGLVVANLGFAGVAHADKHEVQTGKHEMKMMEFWVNPDTVGGWSWGDFVKGIPVMMMMKDGRMMLMPIWTNPDTAGAWSLDDLARNGVPVMMKMMMKDGKKMMVPIWANPDTQGGFSYEEFAEHRLGK